MSEAPSLLARRITAALRPDLGPHTAERALALACQRAHKTPATLGAEDLEVVEEVLGRMLRTLLGKARSRRVIAWIAQRDPA